MLIQLRTWRSYGLDKKEKREEHLATCDKLDGHNNFDTIVMK